MKNEFYFQILVTEEQKKYAQELVDYSLKNHPISNIWDSKKKDQTANLRFTGTLGEIVFADTYKLNRPTRSFGAIDGQDFGKDFEIKFKEKSMNFDLKTMHRRSNKFYQNYVLNIPARNIKREDSITDFYFCISLHEVDNKTIASFLGYINKQDILENKIGILYKKGTVRTRADKTNFEFFEDTYEVFFKNITTPFTSPRIRKFKDFKIFKLK